MQKTSRARKSRKSNFPQGAGNFVSRLAGRENSEEHARCFHDVLELPAFHAFRLEGHNAPPPSFFPFAK